MRVFMSGGPKRRTGRDRSDGVLLTFADCVRIEAECVIGADGVRRIEQAI
jgi:hypothetical protein